MRDRVEQSIIRKVSLVGIIGNIVLSIFKLLSGIIGKSNVMVSDAIHSLSDVFVTFIAFIGLKISRKKADSKYPYGYERFECVASLILGIVLLLVGLKIGKTGIENIILGKYKTLVIPGIIALIAAIVSIVVKEGMYWYTRYYAKILNSDVFMVDAWHHRSDAFSSIGSLIGILGVMYGFPILDCIASILISLCILKVSYDILKDALMKMLDISCDKGLENNLKDYIKKQDGVICIDSFCSRMFSNRIYIDLEIQVDGDITLREAHNIAEMVHNNVEREYPNVKHIMIHLNPSEKSV